MGFEPTTPPTVVGVNAEWLQKRLDSQEGLMARRLRGWSGLNYYRTALISSQSLVLVFSVFSNYNSINGANQCLYFSCVLI